MLQGTRMPYAKPSLETVDARLLTEAIGPVQAFTSGGGGGSTPANLTPPSRAGNNPTRLNR